MASSGDLDLGSVARALWRSKRRIIAPTLLMTAAAFIAVNLMTPKYKSEARVIVEGRENIYLRPEAVTSQVQLVLSRDLARQVIKQLNLAEIPEFNVALNDLSVMTVLRMIGIARDPSSQSVEERVLTAYFERLTAFSVDKSRVIAIEFASADPELAARVANAIAENYLVLQQVAKQDQARSASQWLATELDKLRLKVSEAEGRVEQFRAKTNLYIGANNTSLASQQLSELNTQLSAARTTKSDAETRARLIRETLRSGQTIEASDVTTSPLIQRLAEQRVTLRAQLAEQSSTLLPQHPRIKELRAQISDLDGQIRTEAERLVRALEADAKIASARLDATSAGLEQLKRQAASTSDQDVQLRALEREAKAQRDLFESYLAKYREASARDSIAAAPADARIISRPSVSNVPYFPKKGPIILITGLATFMLCSAFVVTGALLSGGFFRAAPLPTNFEPVVVRQPAPAPAVVAARSPDNRTRVTDRVAHAPAVAPIPTVPAPPETPQGVATVSVLAVAEALQHAGEVGRRVAVIGTAHDVGTTLTAIGIARALARNARVVLVDLAFNSPNLDVISSDPAAPGLANLVRGEASFSGIITRDRGSRAHVVTAGRIDGDPHALLTSHMLAAALDALAQSYEFMVLDAGAQPELVAAPIVRIAPYAVLMAGTANQNNTALRDQLLSAGFAHVTVLTGAPPALEQSASNSAAA